MADRNEMATLTERLARGARGAVRKIPVVRQLSDREARFEARMTDAARHLEEMDREMIDLRRTLGQQLGSFPTFVPPGHFYSPIPSRQEVDSRADRLFADPPRTLPGIELNEPAQLALLERFRQMYDEQPFGAQKKEGLRYQFEYPAYSYSDALFLHLMFDTRAPDGWSRSGRATRRA
jgi:hypothetical protein